MGPAHQGGRHFCGLMAKGPNRNLSRERATSTYCRLQYVPAAQQKAPAEAGQMTCRWISDHQLRRRVLMGAAVAFGIAISLEP